MTMVTAEEKTLLAERMVTGNLYKLRHLAAMLTPEERSAMGKAAAAKRWGTAKKSSK